MTTKHLSIMIFFLGLFSAAAASYAWGVQGRSYAGALLLLLGIVVMLNVPLIYKYRRN